MADRHNAETAPSRPANKHTSGDLGRRRRPDPECGNCDGRGCMGCVFREHDHTCADDCPTCCAEVESAEPQYPNIVPHSAGAVCCPDERSARTHRDRATWWQHGKLWYADYGTPGFPRPWIGYDRPERRWTR